MKLFLILILMFLLFSSCNEKIESWPEKNTEIDTIFIGNELSKNLFPSNKTWIYKSNDGEYDTVRIQSIDLDYWYALVVHGSVQEGRKEYYTYKYKGSISGRFYDTYSYRWIRRSFGGDFGDGFNIFMTNDSINMYQDNVTYIDSMIVSGRTFYNIYKTNVYDIGFYGLHHFHWDLFYADSIGIIKKETVGEPVQIIWELIN